MMIKRIINYLFYIITKTLPTEEVVESYLNLLAERLATEDVKEAVRGLVKEVMSLDVDGEEKKALVKASLQNLQGELLKSVAMTANWVLDTLIQMTFVSLTVNKRSIFKHDK